QHTVSLNSYVLIYRSYTTLTFIFRIISFFAICPYTTLFRSPCLRLSMKASQMQICWPISTCRYSPKSLILNRLRCGLFHPKSPTLCTGLVAHMGHNKHPQIL